MKKKIYVLPMVLLLAASLTACRSMDDVQGKSENNTAEVKDDVRVEVKTNDDKDKDKDKKEAILKKYVSALEGVYNDHVYPDGKDCGFDDNADLSKNKFAVYDIDGDGKDELIIQNTTTSVAGMAEFIYDYNEESDKVVEQFHEFPQSTYFDNGVVKAGWSHNQGLAGDFWPYNLYKYDKDKDGYNEIASVDAWQRKFAEKNGEGKSYPVDVDTNNDGIIFYIMDNGSYDTSNPVSKENYDNWYQSMVNGAKELSVPYVDLTKENIDNLK